MTPPRAAEALLRWCAPRSDAAPIVGDLQEEYRSRGDADPTSGRLDAWYWREVLRSLPPLLGLRLGRFQRDTLLFSHGIALLFGYYAIVVATLASYDTAVLLLHRVGSGPPAVSPPYLAAAIVTGALSLTIGGYVAAATCSRSPLTAAAGLASVCLVMSILSTWSVWPTLVALGAAALAYHFVMAALVLPGIAAGCFLRLRHAG